jgi:hypothetical protein
MSDHDLNNPSALLRQVDGRHVMTVLGAAGTDTPGLLLSVNQALAVADLIDAAIQVLPASRPYTRLEIALDDALAAVEHRFLE